MSSKSDIEAIGIGARIATGTTGTPTVPADIMTDATDIPATATGTRGTTIGVITAATATITATVRGQE